MASRWCDADDATVRASYPDGRAAVQAALPGRGWPAIRLRAHQLGVRMSDAAQHAARLAGTVTRHQAPWSPDDDALVREHYVGGQAAVTAALPTRSWEAIRTRAKILQVSSSGHDAWSDAQDTQLRAMWAESGAEVIGRSVGRSPAAVHARAAKLGLRRVRRRTQPPPTWAPHLDSILAVISAQADRGEALASQASLGERLGLTVCVVACAIRRLERDGRVRIETAPKSRRAVLPDGRATGWSIQGGAGRPPRPKPIVSTARAKAPVLQLLEGGVPNRRGDPSRFAHLPASSRRCSWPTWPDAVPVAPQPPPYCGAAAAGGHPYCAEHCAVAYVATRRAA